MKPLSLFLSCLVLTSAAPCVLAQQQTADASPAAVPTTPADREIVKLRIMSKNPACSAETWILLGNALMQKSRDSVSHDFSEAYLAYRSALTLKPDHADAMCGMAWVKNSEHDFAAGKMWAEKALATDPQQVDAHALIGDGAVELGNYDQAAHHYQIAMKERPDLSSLSRGAHLLWITGDGTRGDALMQQAIAAGGPYPENVAWCRAELALMLFNRGALLPAEQQAAKAVEAAPGNPRVLAVVARIAAAKKDYPKAIELYEKSISITPTHEALAPLVDLYRVSGEAERAEKQFEAVVTFHTAPHPHADGKMYPNPSLGANAQLARFYADQGKNLEDALKQARAAYERFKNVGTVDTLAWCLFLNGQAAEAKPIIKQAMKYRTQDAEMIFHAAMIHQELKEESTARQLFAKALNLNPNMDPAHAAKCAEMIAMPVVSAVDAVAPAPVPASPAVTATGSAP